MTTTTKGLVIREQTIGESDRLVTLLNPINPDNARILRITAAAGTELADAYSYGTYKKEHVPHFIPI